MHDDDTGLAPAALDPSDEFVARLRSELTSEWAGAPTATFSALPFDERRDVAGHRPQRGMIAAAAAVLIVIAGVVAARVGDDAQPAIPATVPTTTPATVGAVTTAPSESTDLPQTVPATIAPTSSGVPTTVVLDDEFTAIAPLLGRRWVRVPTAERFPVGNEPWFEFAVDGTDARFVGFDGCAQFDDDIRVDEAVVSYVFGAPPIGCGTQVRELFDRSIFTFGADGTTVTATDAEYGGTITFVAVDSLAPLDRNVLVSDAGAGSTGTWRSSTLEPYTFLADGGLRIGPCPDPLTTWHLDGNTLTIDRIVDTALATACAGGEMSGGTRILLALTQTPVVADVFVVGDDVLLSNDDMHVWLSAAAPAPAPLDLARGTLYGFAPMTDLDSDAMVDLVSQQAGDPSFDTGWYVAAAAQTPSDEADCFAGIDMRVVVWGDVTFAFLRVSGQDGPVERLWLTHLGAPADIGPSVRRNGDLPAASGTSTTDEQTLGIGSPITAVTALDLDVEAYDATGATTTPDAPTAVRAHVYGTVGGELTIGNGTITGITFVNPGFC
jgi:hypothetical protein